MGFDYIDFDMPTDYSEEELKRAIRKQLGTDVFTYSLDTKSLDARNKRRIIWKLRVGVVSPAIETIAEQDKPLEIPRLNTKKKVVIVGSGPAGIFSGLYLAAAGFAVTIIERGADVRKRSKLIKEFESGGEFSPIANYSFGEGGAGTFSDGKLTSRTKNIKSEKKYVFDEYVNAGAPEEIKYLAHPHIGTNNLIVVAENQRDKFEKLGGKILFETQFKGLITEGKCVSGISTDKGDIECDYLIIATGHSSFDTFRKLISQGVAFKVKPFALGGRVEHHQDLINVSQWGTKTLPGVKAAEYKLTHRDDTNLPVYSFCMCPGGKIVQATPREGLNIVNGMSYYSRSSPFANSAIVAGLDFRTIYGDDISPSRALDELEKIEMSFFEYSKSFQVPAQSIADFISGKLTRNLDETSYSHGTIRENLVNMYPRAVAKSMQAAMINFSRKIKGWENGMIMGLESKTSSTIQAERDDIGRCTGWDNLYLCGECSGRSGGIVSSAVDGIRAAISIATEAAV